MLQRRLVRGSTKDDGCYRQQARQRAQNGDASVGMESAIATALVRIALERHLRRCWGRQLDDAAAAEMLLQDVMDELHARGSAASRDDVERELVFAEVVGLAGVVATRAADASKCVRILGEFPGLSVVSAAVLGSGMLLHLAPLRRPLPCPRPRMWRSLASHDAGAMRRFETRWRRDAARAVMLPSREYSLCGAYLVARVPSYLCSADEEGGDTVAVEAPDLARYLRIVLMRADDDGVVRVHKLCCKHTVDARHGCSSNRHAGA